MKFMLTFTMKPEKSARNEAFERFLKNRRDATESTKLLGRWTQVHSSKGNDLVESDDPTAPWRGMI